MDILNNTIKTFDPNAKIGEIFIVDIEFTACYDASKKMYNEVYPYIFEQKLKFQQIEGTFISYFLLCTWVIRKIF